MGNDINALFSKSTRHHLHSIWEAAKNKNFEGLDDEEVLLSKIMLEHSDEFYNDFEFADVLDNQEFDAENETNPFMHIIMHSIVEKQLQAKEPIETYQFYNSMVNKRVDRHETIHMIGYIFSYFLFQTLKYKVPFDADSYQKALKFFKDKKPEKMWAALERDMERFTKE